MRTVEEIKDLISTLQYRVQYNTEIVSELEDEFKNGVDSIHKVEAKLERIHRYTNRILELQTRIEVLEWVLSGVQDEEVE